MNTAQEQAIQLKNREMVYRLLRRFYMEEADEEFIELLKGMGFPKMCPDADLNEGYRMLERYLETMGDDSLTDLAVDYAKVFIGAGISSAECAYPYESVYTSKDKIIMQEARDEVIALYRGKGLRQSEALDFPEDHIAMELEFMGFLCEEARLALVDGCENAVTHYEEQLGFLNGHLLNWSLEFCEDISELAETDFYKAAAKMTFGFLNMEQVFLESLIADIK